MSRIKTLILGAAGRDFHVFNTVYRDNPDYEIIAFTAAQIPYINDRKYPAELAGKLYPKGIPIFDESELENLIKKYSVEQCSFAYSDVSHETVMHLALKMQCCRLKFCFNRRGKTMVKSNKPVIFCLRNTHWFWKKPGKPCYLCILKKLGKRLLR